VIHPTAIIDWETVRLGKNVRIGAYSTISQCEIGDDTIVGTHVIIGQPPEHSTEKYEQQNECTGIVRIGERVIIRELSVITLPTAGLTEVMDDVYIMGRCHIAHDCIVEQKAVLSIGTILSGWTRVMEGATVGVAAVTHQFTTIGQYAMIAGNAMVVKDVPPLAKYIPKKDLSVNVYAIRKWGLPLEGNSPITETGFYATLENQWDAKRHKGRAVYQFAKGL
jgi:UDP-N-acetylglucosamine acyltransferase